MALSLLTLDTRELDGGKRLHRAEQGAGFLPRHCEEQFLILSLRGGLRPTKQSHRFLASLGTGPAILKGS